MVDEIASLIKNGTWVFVERLNGQSLISCKWIYKKKVKVCNGNKVKFKAKLVSWGFT